LKRIASLDFLRGYAVLIMLFANTTPYVFDLSNSFYIRFVFSTAAPVFIFISGFTTEMNLQKQSVYRSKLFNRTFQVLFLGVMVDTLIWRIYPFITFDVLYLIAFSQLLIILMSYYKTIAVKWVTLFILFVLFIFFQKNFIYRFDINEVNFTEPINFIKIKEEINPLIRMFFDGWFPILPWAAFAVIGSIIFHYKNRLENKFYFLFIIGLLTLDAPLFFNQNHNLPVRNNYLELWYPPSGLMLFIAVGTVVITIALIPKFIKATNNIFYNLFCTLGKNSLFIYILHALSIAIIDSFKLDGQFNFSIKLFLLLGIVSSMTLAAIIMERIKTKYWWAKTPRGIKFVLGY
jgi:uncharacterized membrane protein